MNHIEKLNFLRFLRESGVKTISNGDSFDEVLEDLQNTQIVFFFTKNAKTISPTIWEDNYALFIGKLGQKSPPYKLCAVDCDVHENLLVGREPCCIQVYQEGRMISENLLEHQDFLDPFTQNCGRKSRFDIAKIEQNLQKTNKKPCINILLLGETGVGKTTWINGFANFMTYGSMTDAEKGTLHTIIPSEFSVEDSNFNEVTVITGQDENEILQPGQSTTQHPKVHELRIDHTIVHLIDTPGIRDCRGKEQDRKNFQSILETASTVKELHGICVFLNPNNLQLQNTLQYCVKELLTKLHSDAAKNIVFCFTHTRGKSYKPEDALDALTVLGQDQDKESINITIGSDNVYCFDSEAYKYLTAIEKCPHLLFSAEDKANFSRSWDVSISEMKRMLEHISSLPPHNVRSTLSLNHVRELVLKLSRPLAEVSRNIITNRAILEDQRKKIEETEPDIQLLGEFTLTNTTQIKVTTLKHPRTVCANPSCVKIWETIDARVNSTEYVTVCHETCHLNGIPRDCIGHKGLKGCRAFQELGHEKCSVCWHSYREHVHIYYDSKQVVKQFADVAIISAIQKGEEPIIVKELLLKGRNALIQEYEAEEKAIKNACCHFAYFLKTNAITIYNDEIEQYLNHLVQEEEMKAKNTDNFQILMYLKQNLASYLEEKLRFETSFSDVGDQRLVKALQPIYIEKQVYELTSLKHSGKSIGDAINSIESGRKAIYDETTVSDSIRLGKNGFISKLDTFLGSKLTSK